VSSGRLGLVVYRVQCPLKTMPVRFHHAEGPETLTDFTVLFASSCEGLETKWLEQRVRHGNWNGAQLVNHRAGIQPVSNYAGGLQFPHGNPYLPECFLIECTRSSDSRYVHPRLDGSIRAMEPADNLLICRGPSGRKSERFKRRYWMLATELRRGPCNPCRA
jgi:hypothetical protein